MKVDPHVIHLFWKNTTHWRKPSLLRQIDAFSTSIAKKYLDIMIQFRKENCGFARSKDEKSSVLNHRSRY